jgi:hypothetical protein
MATPAYLAATSGQQANAGQINQFLGTHSCQYIYTGTSFSSQTTVGSSSIFSYQVYAAQSFIPAANQTLGRVTLYIAMDASPPPWTISIQTSSGAAPSGTVLASTVVPAEATSHTPGFVSIPLPCSLTASTQYWIVSNLVGTSTNNFKWLTSNQASGASASPDGVTWTAQSYGLLYNCYSNSPVVQPLVHAYEDSGARWSTYTFNSVAQPTSIQEWTQGQTTTGYLYSSRTLSYSGGQLVSIA